MNSNEKKKELFAYCRTNYNLGYCNMYCEACMFCEWVFCSFLEYV